MINLWLDCFLQHSDGCKPMIMGHRFSNSCPSCDSWRKQFAAKQCLSGTSTWVFRWNHDLTPSISVPYSSGFDLSPMHPSLLFTSCKTDWRERSQWCKAGWVKSMAHATTRLETVAQYWLRSCFAKLTKTVGLVSWGHSCIMSAAALKCIIQWSLQRNLSLQNEITAQIMGMSGKLTGHPVRTPWTKTSKFDGLHQNTQQDSTVEKNTWKQSPFGPHAMAALLMLKRL